MPGATQGQSPLTIALFILPARQSSKIITIKFFQSQNVLKSSWSWVPTDRRSGVQSAGQFERSGVITVQFPGDISRQMPQRIGTNHRRAIRYIKRTAERFEDAHNILHHISMLTKIFFRDR